MRRATATILTIAFALNISTLALPASSTPIAAQEATPAAGATLGLDGPPIGTPVPQVDAEGVEQGLITVTEVQDPFEGHDPAYPPEEGTRFVVATLAFENTGQEPFDVDHGGVLLQDAAGFIYGLAQVERQDMSIPDFRSATLAPGNRISGVIGFQVPADADPAAVLYMLGIGEQLLVLADLQPETEPAPAPGTPVTYRDAEGVEIGQVTVTEVLDPFEDFGPSYPPDEGSRYVALHVVFENTGQQAFEGSSYVLYLHDADGFIWGWDRVPRPPDATVPDLAGEQALAPGDQVSGLVTFYVPADAQLTAVLYQPESYLQDARYYPEDVRLIRLVDLTAVAPAQTPTPEPAPTATAMPLPTATLAPEPMPTPEPGTIRVAAAPAGGPVSLASGAAVELILDTSGSMLQPLGDGLRIDVAKAALTDVVTSTVPPGTPLVLRVFGSEPDSCETNLAIPLQPLDPASASEQIATLQAVNLVKTPIGASLERVTDDLAGIDGPKVVVLVTDGEETCGGDPAAAIQALRDAGIDVRVNIVGFAVDDTALEAQFAEWARIGGGVYVPADAPEDLGPAIATALAPPFRVLAEDGTVVAQGTVGGEPIEVPAGTYTVEVLSESPQVFEGVVVNPREDVQLTLEDQA
jgi:hypothetical protein